MTTFLLDDARSQAVRLDAADPLGHLRERFDLPPHVVYLDGNSLGALPVGVPNAVEEVTRRQWGQDLIGSWNEHDWWGAPRRVGARLAALVGAHEDEVVVADSTSVNLFKVLVAAARLRPSRSVVVVEPGNFPSDLYIVDAAADLLDLTVARIEPSDLEAELTGGFAEDVAVVAYSHVDFRTGRLHDMGAITTATHAAGGLSVWDLSHSAGAVDVDLGACEVDFAIGCTYKYLNGGPGSPAYVMASRRHHRQMRSPIPGWTGHARPFAMESSYTPADGVDQLRCGTPPMLSLLALEQALEVFAGISTTALRDRSRSLTSLFLELADAHLESRGFRVLTPRRPAERGSQVSLAHEHAYGVVQALVARGVIGDFREPDVVRLGFSPLYVTHGDVVEAVAQLVDVVRDQAHLQSRWQERGSVT